jgi:beta-aspartyl-peptidase (threonine type)
MKKGSSLDGVEAAVEYMESCGVFNAGKGACLTADGTVELDAAIMSGAGRVGAGVGCVTCTYQAVSLARWVAEKTRHVLIVGDECETYARKARVKLWKATPSQQSLERYRVLSKDREGRLKIRLWRRIQEGNTVGAAALDSGGVPAAAVSTGGKWLKLPGRVGDSAILGAGVYADSRSGASSATGEGEEIIKNSLCYRACDYLKKRNAQQAADDAIALITRESGSMTAGIVTVDLRGRVGAAFNTEAMGRAWYDGRRGRPQVLC